MTAPVREALMTVLALAVGAGIGLGLIGPAIAVLPHDLARLRVVEAALPTTTKAVFGNSVCMNGVDTNLIDPALRNLCTVGQSLGVAMIFVDAMPEEAEEIVLVVGVRDLEFPDPVLNARPYDFLRQGGTRPSTEVLDILRRFLPADFALERNPAERLFALRFIVQQAPQTELRKLVRSDLDEGGSMTSLHAPAPYQKKAAPHKTAMRLAAISAKARSPGFHPDKKRDRFLRLLIARAQKKAKRVTVVLAPSHPALDDYFGADFFAQARTYAHSLGAPVVDTMHLLPAADFLDHVHPSRNGAERLSLAIAQGLRH